MPVAGTKMVKVVDYLLDIDSIHDVEEIIRMIKSTPASSAYVQYTCSGNGKINRIVHVYVQYCI